MSIAQSCRGECGVSAVVKRVHKNFGPDSATARAFLFGFYKMIVPNAPDKVLRRLERSLQQVEKRKPENVYGIHCFASDLSARVMQDHPNATSEEKVKLMRKAMARLKGEWDSFQSSTQEEYRARARQESQQEVQDNLQEAEEIARQIEDRQTQLESQRRADPYKFTSDKFRLSTADLGELHRVWKAGVAMPCKQALKLRQDCCFFGGVDVAS